MATALAGVSFVEEYARLHYSEEAGKAAPIAQVVATWTGLLTTPIDV